MSSILHYSHNICCVYRGLHCSLVNMCYEFEAWSEEVMLSM